MNVIPHYGMEFTCGFFIPHYLFPYLVLVIDLTNWFEHVSQSQGGMKLSMFKKKYFII